MFIDFLEQVLENLVANQDKGLDQLQELQKVSKCVHSDCVRQVEFHEGLSQTLNH